MRRERGLEEAKYAFLGFVDDDNWLAHDWVRAAYDVFLVGFKSWCRWQHSNTSV
jgi:hypothetical protein